MSFTKLEKDVLRSLIDVHLKDIQRIEKFPNLSVQATAADIRYDLFLKHLRKKLR